MTSSRRRSSARERWEDRPEEMAPFSWLYRIVVDCLCDEWRRHNRVGLGGLRCQVPWPEGSSAQLAGSLTSPSEALARGEQIERVHQVMAALDEEDRNVLTIRILDGLTFDEMGAVLGVNLNRGVPVQPGHAAIQEGLAATGTREQPGAMNPDSATSSNEYDLRLAEFWLAYEAAPDPAAKEAAPPNSAPATPTWRARSRRSSGCAAGSSRRRSLSGSSGFPSGG